MPALPLSSANNGGAGRWADLYLGFIRRYRRNAVRARPCLHGFAFPAQLYTSPRKQLINGRMHNGHRYSPVTLPGHSARDFTGADCSPWLPCRQKPKQHCTSFFDTHLRPPGRELRPLVIRSGLCGRFQPEGGATFCWLVPNPIAPGLGRSSPETSAAAASSKVAPPRIRLIMSRRRFASS